MPLFYLDTSALLKRYRTEEGTPVIDHLFTLLERPDNKGAISFLTLLEVIAAGRRLLKGGIIEESDFAELLSKFTADVNRYFALRGIDVKLFIRAIEVSLQHGLRAADALQLATALHLKEILERTAEQLVVIVDDEEFYKAAKKEGLETLNPRGKAALKRLRQLTKERPDNT